MLHLMCDGSAPLAVRRTLGFLSCGTGRLGPAVADRPALVDTVAGHSRLAGPGGCGGGRHVSGAVMLGRLTASSRCHHGHMADSRLLTSHDYVVPYDHGQFWLCSCLCVEEDYPLDVVPLPDYDEMANLDYREIQDEGIWQI